MLNSNDQSFNELILKEMLFMINLLKNLFKYLFGQIFEDE